MVSVAIATYNGEKYIEEQLESIFRQTVKVDEVVICDDKSTDNTVKIINRFIEKNKLYSKWKIIVNEKNLGYIKNFLKAISLTKGDYIFLSDQDDIFYPNKFEKMINYFNRNEDCLLLNANYEIIDETGRVSENFRTMARKKRNKKIEKINFRKWIYVSSFPGFSMGFRSLIRERLLNMDITDCYGHDQLIGLLAINEDGNYVISDVLSGYRIHLNNTTGGKNITNNYSISKRIEQKTKELQEYQQLEKIIVGNDIKNVDMKFLMIREKELRKRIKYLKSKNVIGLLGMVIKSKAYPKETILGDCLYILKGID